MTLKIADRVKETSSTTGTGTLNLGGASTGFQTFVAGVGNSNTCFYAISHQTTSEWEVGIGTVTDASPDTLARTTVLQSSNSDNAVDLSAGIKDVFVTYPAGKAVYKDATGKVGIGTESPSYTLDVREARAGYDSWVQSSGVRVGPSGTVLLDADLSRSITVKAPDVVSTSFTLPLPSGIGSNGQVLTTDSKQTYWSTVSGGGSPGGSDTQIQFNDDGSFGGDIAFAWDKDNRLLIASGNILSNSADASHARTLTLGSGSYVTDADATVVGIQGTAGRYGVSVGRSSSSAQAGVAIGNSAQTAANDGVAIGKDSYANQDGVAVGMSSDGPRDGVGIGKNAGSSNSARFSVLIGESTQSAGNYGIAIGHSAQVSHADGISIGANSDSTGANGIALGSYAQAPANGFVVASGSTVADDALLSGKFGDYMSVLNAKFGVGTESPSYTIDAFGHDAWVRASGVHVGPSGVVIEGSSGSGISVKAQGTFGDYTLMLPSGNGTNGQVLTTDSKNTYWTVPDHDALTNFVANEHIDHSSVSVSAGTGLTGGGTIASTRTLSVDINGTADLGSPAVGDELLISDLDDSNTVKKADLASIVNLADHDALTNFVANEHIDWTTDQGSTNIHAGNYTSGASSIDDLDDVSWGGTNLTYTLLLNNTPGSAPVTGTLAGDCQYNIGVGVNCLRAITNADNNIAIGRNNAYKETTAQGNIYLGQSNAYNHIASSGNIGIGNGVLYGHTGTASQADYNVGIGEACLYDVQNGGSNVAIGKYAGYGVSKGSHNVTIGSNAGYGVDTGSGNVVLGRRAGYGIRGNRNIVIGWKAGYQQAADDTLIIANESINSSGTLIKGDMYGKFLAMGEGDGLHSHVNAPTLQVYPSGNRPSSASITPYNGYAVYANGSIAAGGPDAWVQASGVNVGASGIVLKDADLSHEITVKAPDVVSTSFTLPLPSGIGTNGQVLTTDSKQTYWSTVSGGGGVDTTGTPANDQVAIFTDADTLEGDSDLQFDGTNLGIGVDPTAPLHIDVDSNDLIYATATGRTGNSRVRFISGDGDNNNNMTLQVISGPQANAYFYMGDTDDPDNGYIRYKNKDDDNTMYFRTNAKDKMIIGSDGRIGLGAGQGASTATVGHIDVVAHSGCIMASGIRGCLETSTDQAVINFDIASSTAHNVVLGGDRTLAVKNTRAGDRFILRLTQDGTGSRDVTWFSTIKWAGGSAPTLTTTPSKADVIGFLCTGTNAFDGFVIGQNI
jgi:hypothetical protein